MGVPDLRVVFALREHSMDPPSNEFKGTEVRVNINSVSGELIKGEYEYKSDPNFGSSEESNGHIIFDKKSPLFAITARHDQPKASSILRSLDEALNTDVASPDVSASSQHEIYMQNSFGRLFNGSVVSFKEQQTDHMNPTEPAGMRIDPDKRASEIRSQGGEANIQEMVKSLIDDGLYIWSADIKIDGHIIRFCDPLRFIGVDDDWAEDEGFEKLFSISRGAI